MCECICSSMHAHGVNTGRCAQVLSVSVCVRQGEGGAPGVQVYRCVCPSASLQASEGVAPQWLEGLSCRSGPSSSVWGREAGEVLRTKGSPLPHHLS